MLRTRLGRLVGAAILAAILVLPASGIAAASTPDDGNHAPARDQARLRARGPQPARAHLPQPRRRVPLDPPTGVDIREFRLWKAVDGGERHLLAVIPSGAPHRFADFRIRTGHAYHYFVAGIGPTGRGSRRAPSSPSGSAGRPRSCGSTA